MSTGTFLLYFLSFCFLPFIFLLCKKELPADIKFFKWAILLSGLLLALMSFFFYKDIIGTVGRISLAISKDENYISPLALSYSGSLTMGVALLLLFTGKNSKFDKLVLIGIAGVSCIPFFLGASRGSVLALAVPFVMFIFFQKSKLTSIYLLIVFILLSAGVVALSEQFGSAVIDRFVGIEADVDSGSSSASRINIWDYALNHFFDNPLFGKYLEVPETNFHPHNIFIEVLMATGIFGFIPFLYLIGKTMQYTLYIFKHKPEVAWVSVIFLQSLIHYSFSGAIYGASWMWFSMAIILSMNLKPTPRQHADLQIPNHRPSKAVV
ncbi:O-antigen ligase family protein [Pontibacter sp. E15-1]|uniref:O-antigen ligase family protein n=1 Tax=Pontibacter sp. E15-1 TaxID=2919918 RepID=UPI001F4F49A5|nr:O-antigen ligase family protein [Pontibacter sp. E15-1]MCJ8164430.1 O-antigen ligase family protein [Pontibacter sp. E15-1]